MSEVLVGISFAIHDSLDHGQNEVGLYNMEFHILLFKRNA